MTYLTPDQIAAEKAAALADLRRSLKETNRHLRRLSLCGVRVTLRNIFEERPRYVISAPDGSLPDGEGE